MRIAKIEPGRLRGEISVPPSKSISHRAIICASLAEGTSEIDNFIMSHDMEATMGGMRALGAEIDVLEGENNRKRLRITGGSRQNGAVNIDCNESGSTLRFLIPIALVDQRKAVFQGRGKLVSRPLDSYYGIFEKNGISYSLKDGQLPLSTQGSLKSGTYEIGGGISSQFVSGLLFSLPLLKGDSEIVIEGGLESKGYVDLTQDILQRFGIQVQNRDHRSYGIPGGQTYSPADVHVEGDYSQAAFWLAGGVLGDGIRTTGTMEKTSQGDAVIEDIIRGMNGRLSRVGDSLEAGPSSLDGVTVDVSQCPDLVPILAVLGTLGQGVMEITNGARVRIKESDRLKAISTELNKLGGNIRETRDGLVIKGVDRLRGGEVESWNDHRIAMALAIAATRADGQVTIRGSEAVNKSYPNFWDDFGRLGGKVDERELG